MTEATTRTPREEGDPFRLGKRPALDGLRGVAVLLVVAFHTVTFLVSGRDNGRVFPGGFIGVNLFFVLSGFLITSLLVQEEHKSGQISFRRFYIRRARRLLPALVAVLAAFVAWSAAYGDSLRPLLPAIAVVALFSANLAPAFGIIIPWSLSQTWSLGIEEQFYLLWPLALLLLLRRCRPRILFTILTVVVVGMAVTSAVAFSLHHSAIGFFERAAQANGIMIGCGLALALHWGWKPPRWLRIATLPAVGLLVVTALTTFLSNPWLPDGGYTLIALAVAIIILGCLDHTTLLARALSWSPLRYCGKISYAVYLWHLFVFIAVVRVWPGLNTPERIALCLSVAAVVPIASRYLVELPFTRRRPALPSRNHQPVTREHLTGQPAFSPE